MTTFGMGFALVALSCRNSASSPQQTVWNSHFLCQFTQFFDQLDSVLGETSRHGQSITQKQDATIDQHLVLRLKWAMISEETVTTIDQLNLWLISEGRALGDETQIVKCYCEELVRLGAPLSRVRIAQSYKNPLLSAWGIIWTPEETKRKLLRVKRQA